LTATGLLMETLQYVLEGRRSRRPLPADARHGGHRRDDGGGERAPLSQVARLKGRRSAANGVPDAASRSRSACGGTEGQGDLALRQHGFFPCKGKVGQGGFAALPGFVTATRTQVTTGVARVAAIY